MSHVVKCKVNLTNTDALNTAIGELGLTSLGVGNHKMYGGQHVQGVGFKLPDWQYPVVIDEKGVAHYDNYGGSWGKQIELDKLVQSYTIETAKIEAAEQGYTVETVDQEGGDVEVIMTQLAST